MTIHARPILSRLGLTLVVGSQPIEGAVTDASGRTWPFTGWIELSTLLERAHTQALATSAPLREDGADDDADRA